MKLFRYELNEDVSLADLDRTHRIEKKSDSSSEPHPLIVKIAQYNICEKVSKSKKKLKAKNISITESLTTYQMSVLNEASKKYGFKNVWTYDGRISFIVMSIMNGNYNFISNNIKGIEASEKRLKLFEYLKNNINDYGIIFLQETHLLSNDELKLKEEFGGPLFFHMEKAILVGWQSAIVVQILKW